MVRKSDFMFIKGQSRCLEKRLFIPRIDLPGEIRPQAILASKQDILNSKFKQKVTQFIDGS